MGHQRLESQKNKTEDKVTILSSFEYAQKSAKKIQRKCFVSNSLAARRDYLQQFGGEASMPSYLRSQKFKDSFPVYLVGADHLNAKLWGECKNYFKKVKK